MSFTPSILALAHDHHSYGRTASEGIILFHLPIIRDLLHHLALLLVSGIKELSDSFEHRRLRHIGRMDSSGSEVGVVRMAPRP